jgi:hypothetical protein
MKALYQIAGLLLAEHPLASRFASSAESPAFGGIGTAPHAPLPPARIFSARRAAAPRSPAYFCATSRNGGPTSFFVTSWHALQAFRGEQLRDRIVGHGGKSVGRRRRRRIAPVVGRR